MTQSKDRKGLAIGAVIALLASFFGAATPASAAATDGAQIAMRPVAGDPTNFNGLLATDFPIYVQMLDGYTSSNFATDRLKWEVTMTSGDVDLLIQSAAKGTVSISDTVSPGSTNNYIFSPAVSGTDNASVSAFIDQDRATRSVVLNAKLNPQDIGYLYLRAFTSSGNANSITSESNTVTLTVKAFIDYQGGSSNGVHDADEWFVTKTITLRNINDITTTWDVTVPTVSASVVLADVTVGNLNTANVDGSFFIAATASGDVFGADLRSSFAKTYRGAHLYTNSYEMTHSAAVDTFSQSTDLYFAARWYSMSFNPASASAGVKLGTVGYTGTGANALTSLTAVVPSTDNVTISAGDLHKVRANRAATVKFGAMTNSTTVSGATVNVAVTFSGALALGGKLISVNGGALTTSLPTALALTTDADGYANLTLQGSNFAADDVLYVTATAAGVTEAVAFVMEDVNWSLTQAVDYYNTGAGVAVPVQYMVKDQWGVSATSAADLRIKASQNAGTNGFAWATTLSYTPVTSGVVDVSITPSPATKTTGSFTVTADLQQYYSSTARWADTSDQLTTTVNVSAVADSFDADSPVAASYSVSVSYFPNSVTNWNTASYVAVAGSVANTGSVVVASGTGLVFKNSAGVTFSDTMTLRTGANGDYTVNVAGEKAGVYTLTLTAGTAVTTSLIYVDAVTGSAGYQIVFDTTTIESGKTKIIVGTVQDRNGNPVNTTLGSATIEVTYAGTAGIPVGSMPVETNASGEFRVSVLTSAADEGSFTLTAVYASSGASTLVKDLITKVQTITVAPAAADSSTTDQKITVGSFKGFVAIYTLGYTGQKLSAKVAGKWLVKEDLARFERVVRLTGAGYTIKVDLYIDGVFVRSETVLTK